MPVDHLACRSCRVGVVPRITPARCPTHPPEITSRTLCPFCVAERVGIDDSRRREETRASRRNTVKPVHLEKKSLTNDGVFSFGGVAFRFPEGIIGTIISRDTRKPPSPPTTVCDRTRNWIIDNSRGEAHRIKRPATIARKQHATASDPRAPNFGPLRHYDWFLFQTSPLPVAMALPSILSTGHAQLDIRHDHDHDHDQDADEIDLTDRGLDHRLVQLAGGSKAPGRKALI